MPRLTDKEVSKIQRVLAYYGIYSGPVDGIYGTLTEHAVGRYQTSKGLVPDGQVGVHTLVSLLAEPTKPETHSSLIGFIVVWTVGLVLGAVLEYLFH